MIANNLLLAVVSQDTRWSRFETECLANANGMAFKCRFTKWKRELFLSATVYSTQH